MVSPRQFAYDLSRHIVSKKLVNLQGVPCPDSVRSVAEFTASHPVLARVPSEGIRLVGEKLGRCFSTTSEPGMKLISSLNTALYEFHESGICVSGFDESNLVVSDNTQEQLFRPIKSDRIEPPQDLPPGVFMTQYRRDKYRAGAAGFLDFYYDVSINKMEWCWSPRLKSDGGYPPGQAGYTDDEHEIVTSVTYPELMPRIQEALWKTNHLKKARGS